MHECKTNTYSGPGACCEAVGMGGSPHPEQPMVDRFEACLSAFAHRDNPEQQTLCLSLNTITYVHIM